MGVRKEFLVTIGSCYCFRSVGVVTSEGILNWGGEVFLYAFSATLLKLGFLVVFHLRHCQWRKYISMRYCAPRLGLSKANKVMNCTFLLLQASF